MRLDFPLHIVPQLGQLDAYVSDHDESIEFRVYDDDRDRGRRKGGVCIPPHIFFFQIEILIN